MEWITTIKKTIKYIEDNLLEINNLEEIASNVNISLMHLQKGFLIMTGFSIGEYIRNRKLYEAAIEIASSKAKIIDIAYKYGYETPESFTKAFKRFHGMNPSNVKNDKNHIKKFIPLHVNIVVNGGYDMDYTIKHKTLLKLIGFSKEFSSETSYKEIPEFWDEVYSKNLLEKNKYSIGEFGVCIDDIGTGGKFRYMIAGRYDGGIIPDGMVVYEVPESLFAIFDCVGPMPDSMQSVNTMIWKEWLPGNGEYELSGSFNLEWYSDGDTNSPTYHSAIWIPVRKR